MPTAPTTRIPTWADGAADVTDPGSSKQATGWVEGEAPAADHTNWLHNARGEWLNFIWKSSLPTIIASNLVDKNTQPFGTDLQETIINWEPTQEKFYATCLELTSDDLITYESTDGISWSGGTVVNLNDTSPRWCRVAYCPDNAKIGIGSEAGFHLSSTNSVSGFSQTPTGTFASITAASGLVWDNTNNLWIACGEDSGDGYIETAASAGASWTQRDTEASSGIQSIVHDRNGTTVAVYEGVDLIHHSSNGTTWIQQTTGISKTFRRAWWAPFASVFVAHEPAGNTMYWSTDGDVWALCPFGTVDSVIMCENCMLFIDLSWDMHFVGSLEAIKGEAPYVSMGINVSSDNLEPNAIHREYTGSGLGFSYVSEDDTLVNCTFGA